MSFEEFIKQPKQNKFVKIVIKGVLKYFF